MSAIDAFNELSKLAVLTYIFRDFGEFCGRVPHKILQEVKEKLLYPLFHPICRLQCLTYLDGKSRRPVSFGMPYRPSQQHTDVEIVSRSFDR